MTLTTQLAGQVSKEIRQRGRLYFLEGAVRILAGDDRSVRATVRGSQPYSVSLSRTRNSLKVGCTCPYFQDHLYTCKHIWAAILAAENHGFLGSSPTGRLQIVEDEDFIAEEDEADWEEEAEQDGYDWGEWDNGFADDRPGRVLPHPTRPVRPSVRGRQRRRDWKEELARLRQASASATAGPSNSWPAGREILYIVDVPATLTGQGLTVEVAYRERKRDGEWGKPKFQRLPVASIPLLPNPADRRILSLLVGAREQINYAYSYDYLYPSYDWASCRYRLSEPLADALIPEMCRTGRCRLRVQEDADLRDLRWDEGGPWEFWLVVAPDSTGKHYVGEGWLRRGAERVPLAEPRMLAEGLVFWDDRAACFEDCGAFDWVRLLRQRGPLQVPVKQGGELVKELLRLPHLPRLELPSELRYEEVALPPRPYLKVRPPERRVLASSRWQPAGSNGNDRLRGELFFDYDGEVIAADQPERGIYQADRRRLIVRDRAAEEAAAEQLRQLGFRPQKYSYESKPRLELAPRNLPRVIRTLLEAGWHVEAEGKLYRQPGAIHMEVVSGIDWFDLKGTVEFGNTTAALPALLAALKKGENTVRLDDGTYGMLPEEWLKKYGLLAGLGKVEGDRLRFTRSQVGLLDALLAAQPEACCDETFARAREELRRFEGIKPADAPAGFVGELRGYQREGLGWLYFLQRFGFGGCLADDMGLGKTVQVLALLESRRELREKRSKKNGAEQPGPSLVVVPRSLVFNWKQEVARFTPKLRVLDHTGTGRLQPGQHFNDYDVILTTYGTLRRDAAHFKDVLFDYCILDEAQAIKNARTEAAKAVRLLRGNHRLALSGTPVENHLGELWSLFEFLNPGMLGGASAFRLGGVGAHNPDEDTRALLARALRPFILRRTKEQVAAYLPAKTEQTLYCELEPAQRKQYNDLREHYRRTLLGKVEEEGIAKAKIQVLEALLRLRQAACHPGLIDPAKVSESSAKLDLLLPQLDEVLEEGHKALVFSQFTSLLAIVRDRLDRQGVPYEYLDGKTRDREARVERFQNDPDCKLFLISLRAGGLGLNLTAAEYVFLLDPWWNPAVEAQAIDRAHRLGQKRAVFAYRLIARDTVEEKVLELQTTKRDLADAIINADNSLIRDLTADDLRLLLS